MKKYIVAGGFSDEILEFEVIEKDEQAAREQVMDCFPGFEIDEVIYIGEIEKFEE